MERPCWLCQTAAAPAWRHGSGITALGSIGAAPGFDISVQSAGERGFVAILTDGSTQMGSTVTWLVLLSDTGVREQHIGKVRTFYVSPSGQYSDSESWR